ncbi:hypothetical protein SK128_021763 [Halocaridina rubra]|uniref:Uncharacterized protein n=1 Tax=Halocaridina rubra TaxID=373956 RepID=A0AAN8XDP4_HALRR
MIIKASVAFGSPPGHRMFAFKIAFLGTAACLLVTSANEDVKQEILDLVGLFPSSYDYTGRAYGMTKENSNYLDEEDQDLIDMAEDLMNTPEDRAVSTTLTASEMADALTAATLDKLRDIGWTTKKNFQNQYTDVPYKAGGDNKNMRVELRKGSIKGLGSLKKESASLNKNTNTLRMRMGLRGVYVDGNYVVSVPSAGAAPSNRASGHVQDKLKHAWVDATVRVDDNGVPVNIQSFQAGSGTPLLTQTTNLSGNKYGPVYRTAFAEALRQITLNMMESNLRVKFNQALQGIKAAGSYDEWL